MNTTKLKTSRLVFAAAAVALVLAVVVAAYLLSGWSVSAESPARDAAERKAQDAAEIYCNMDGVVPGMSGVDDPAYLECVKQRAKKEMAKWDASH
jgi:hypothetical protein